VLDRRLYELCKNLGFALFCGSFFKFPEKISARKLSSNQALRLNLLKLIERENPIFRSCLKRFNPTRQSVPTIGVYQFRRFFIPLCNQINSSSNYAARLVENKKLAKSCIAHRHESKQGSGRACSSLAQRGLFLELVARDHDFWGFDPENLHLLGIFLFWMLLSDAHGRDCGASSD